MASDTPPVVSIQSLAPHVGNLVTLQGWLYNKRSSKKLVFLEVRDGTGIVQAIVSRDDLGDERYNLADRMPPAAPQAFGGDVGADLAIYNPIGRLWYLSASVRF